MSDITALVYQPHSYTRRGPPETCMQIVQRYPGQGLKTRVMLVRARVATPDNVEIVGALPRWMDSAPWKLIRRLGVGELNRRFLRQLEKLDPANTIVTIWPGWPIPPLAQAKRLGFTLVREMINCSCATSRPILDAAYERQGRVPDHTVTPELVAAESEELQLYDYIFSGNAEVDRSLLRLGIPEGRILKTTFGWDSSRFEGGAAEPKPEGSLRFLFVGSVGIRKGVPELLEAWKAAAIPDAELLIIGNVEEGYRELFARQMVPGVRHLPFSLNIGGFYKSTDVFVFPTLEEGGPQVVYEAAGCGAAVIVTPMGQARMVEHEVNGVVVPPGDSEALAAALRRIAADADLRRRLRDNAARDAKRFEYQKVGEERARMLLALMRDRAAKKSAA